MRTTVQVDDDVLSVARALARQDGRSLGAVLSGLARQGLRAANAGSTVPGSVHDLPVFDVPTSAPVFGPDEVAAVLDEP